MRICPLDGSTRRFTILNRVVLPLPDPPSSTSTSPSASSSDTRATATCAPNDLLTSSRVITSLVFPTESSSVALLYRLRQCRRLGSVFLQRVDAADTGVAFCHQPL